MARQSPETLRREAPVDEVIARVHIPRFVNLDRRAVGGQARTVGLEHDLATRREHIRERRQQRDRIGHPVQDPETQHNVKALAERAHVQRIHPAVLNPRPEQPGDRAEADTALKRHTEASTHPGDVLLIIDSDNTPRTAGLGEEAVEAVKRADVEHAAPRKTIRAENREAVAVVAGDPRRVDPGREREGVKPERNRVADALGVHRRRADRMHVSDEPLGQGRLGDRFGRLDRVCMGWQRISSSLSFT